MKVNITKTPLFMTETAVNIKSNRKKMTQVAFESLSRPSFYVCAGNTLALYASGRTTGITINCGYDTTHGSCRLVLKQSSSAVKI